MGGACEIIDCDLVNNQNGYVFKKLCVGGVCQFDDFYDEVSRSKLEYKNLVGIIALMDSFGGSLLPKEKFRQIKNVGRSDIYEFKKKGIRVYVMLQKPDVLIILGGYKKNQTQDIKLLKRRLALLQQ